MSRDKTNPFAKKILNSLESQNNNDNIIRVRADVKTIEDVKNLLKDYSICNEELTPCMVFIQSS